ncbi:hypothetical protein Hanom_Chr01g00060961 [Helianthus anomalus]
MTRGKVFEVFVPQLLLLTKTFKPILGFYLASFFRLFCLTGTKMPLQTGRVHKIVDENGSNKGLLTLFQSHVNHFCCLMVLKYVIYIKEALCLFHC